MLQGHCDDEKQYCCFNAKSRPYSGGNRPLPEPGFRPQEPDRRPILVGPGGPTGIVTQGSRPFRPPFREEEDRPPYQGYGTINDDNFPRPPYDPLSRNANLEAKKNGKKL